MNIIEAINQVFDLVNNVKDLYLFCQEHLPNGIFLPIGISTTFQKKDKKKRKDNKRSKHKNARKIHNK